MIRLGRISYVNMAPVFFELEADVEEVSGVPTELNERLVAGEIDLAPDLLDRLRRATPTDFASCRASASPPKAPSTRSSSSRARPSTASTPSR